VWGKGAPLNDLLTPVRPGEEFDGESTRLGAYAARLWLPLLRAERDPD
jgi:exodeoxyribonuclease V gamma subunit